MKPHAQPPRENLISWHRSRIQCKECMARMCAAVNPESCFIREFFCISCRHAYGVKEFLPSEFFESIIDSKMYDLPDLPDEPIPERERSQRKDPHP